MVLACLDIGIFESTLVIRKSSIRQWQTGQALSVRLQLSIGGTLTETHVDDAERFSHNTLFSILRLHIRERTLHERTSAHPCVHERCLLAIRAQNAPHGTDEFIAASAACSATLFDENLKYIRRMRDKLHKETRGSKGWCRVADRIMEKQGVQEVIPVLRNSDAVWVRDPADTANLLARTFSNKFVLPD